MRSRRRGCAPSWKTSRNGPRAGGEKPRAMRRYSNQYIIRALRRDQLRAYLHEQGIGTEIYYPSPLHLQVCYKDLGYGPGSFPYAERAAQETLALPIYAELAEDQQAYVVETIKKFYGRS